MRTARWTMVEFIDFSLHSILINVIVAFLLSPHVIVIG